MIGLIVPPAQIKKLAEKTAQYVANNGSEFEQLVWEKQKNDPKFAFLKKENPYRGYYDHMINQYTKELMEEAQKVKEQQYPNQNFVKQQIVNISRPIQQQQKAFFEKAFQDIKAPDPELYYVDIPQKITLAEMDIIQHTAQYVAKNGKNFLVALNEREKNNPQFQFLKSTSNHFKYFMGLVDGYTKILSFKNSDVFQLVNLQTDKYYVLSKCIQKFQYEKIQEQSKAKKPAENDKDKDLNIDWNDFELVETIAFDDQASLRNSVKEELHQLMRRKQMQHTNILEKPIEEITLTTSKRKQVLQQCSVCDRHIPASEMSHHLKLCMLDPKYKEKRDQQLKRKQESKSIGFDISQNLNNLKHKRPDIFGASEDNFQLEQEVAPKKEEKKLIWDGQAANVTRTTATITMMNHQQRKLIEQIKNKDKKQK